MEAEISLGEYLIILIGCGVGVYLFTKILNLLSIEDCGEVFLRMIALIALAFFSVPPTCLCSTGFKNNKKLCSFMSKFFLLLNFLNFMSLIYIFHISNRPKGADWHTLESSCSLGDSQGSEITFKTTPIILC